MGKIKIGISLCLLGERVRYDATVAIRAKTVLVAVGRKTNVRG